MIERRPFSSLGGENHGWLDAKHHFSFAGYRDDARMNWGNLRVWNDDVIAPNSGFPPHPHRFQIWIMPTKAGEAPSWGARPFPKGDRSGRFVTLASGYDNDNDALPIRTDARVVAATLKAGESADYVIGADRKAYLVPATGAVEVNGVRIDARDGAAIRDVETITVTALVDAEVVLVDAA